MSKQMPDFSIKWPVLKDTVPDPEQRRADDEEFLRLLAEWPYNHEFGQFMQRHHGVIGRVWHSGVSYGRRTAPPSIVYPDESPAEKLKNYRQWIPAKFPTDWKVSPKALHENSVSIQSQFGEHDEMLVLDGNFAGAEECRAYAERIALVLNAFFSKTQPEDVPIIKNMVAIDKGCYDLMIRWLERDVKEGRATRQLVLDVLQRGSVLLDVDKE